MKINLYLYGIFSTSAQVEIYTFNSNQKTCAFLNGHATY